MSIRLPVLLLASQLVWAVEIVPLYTDYADPPFSTDSPDSLTTRLAAALSGKSGGRYQFVATQLPRRRLDQLIATPGWKGVVAWANPVWFADERMSRFIWSKPFIRDADLVVSLRTKPVEYEHGGATLMGLRLGGINGHRYVDVERYISTGQLVRDDAAKELQSLQKLRVGRVDVAFVQASSLPFFRRTLKDIDSWLYVARNPRSVYQRHLFAAAGQRALIDFIDVACAQLQTEPAWRAVLDQVAINKQSNP